MNAFEEIPPHSVRHYQQTITVSPLSLRLEVFHLGLQFETFFPSDVVGHVV